MKTFFDSLCHIASTVIVTAVVFAAFTVAQAHAQELIDPDARAPVLKLNRFDPDTDTIAFCNKKDEIEAVVLSDDSEETTAIINRTEGLSCKKVKVTYLRGAMKKGDTLRGNGFGEIGKLYDITPILVVARFKEGKAMSLPQPTVQWAALPSLLNEATYKE